jgi:hypothetical protein
VSWARLDDGFDTHPKILELTETERWRWTRVLLYCARHETEGEISRRVVRELGLSRALNQLLKSNLLLASTSDADVFVVNDWAIYNPGARDDEAVENAVRWALEQRGEGASANEIARMVGGNRKVVLSAIRRVKGGSANGSRVVPGTSAGTSQGGSRSGSEVVPELVRAQAGARDPSPKNFSEGTNVAVDLARAEPVDNQFAPPTPNGAAGNGTATGFTRIENLVEAELVDLEGQS